MSTPTTKEGGEEEVAEEVLQIHDATDEEMGVQNERKKSKARTSKSEPVSARSSTVGVVMDTSDVSLDSFSWNNFTRTQLAVYSLLFLAYNGYLVYAFLYWQEHDNSIEWCDGLGFILIITLMVYLALLYFLYFKPVLGATVTRRFINPIHNTYGLLTEFRWARFIIYLLLFLIFCLYIGYVAYSPSRLISILGIFVLILFGFVFSKHPSRIKWPTVVKGLCLQFIFGVLTLKWQVGRDVFDCLGDKIATFLSFTKSGAGFAYGYLATGTEVGENVLHPVFFFHVLSVIYFFSFIMNILYYWGVMQWIVVKLGYVLQVTMGTTACESINAAASIFVGMTESPLVIKPYVELMTKSELHAVCTAGLATIAGSVMAAYISFGISPSHLLTASVMSAPAALCYAKLFYPETEVSLTKAEQIIITKREEVSVLDAATRGATAAIYLVLGIVANIIAFVACLAFLDAILGWAGALVGASFLSFQWIMGKVFIPLAWLMGVEPADCEAVGTLVGIKTTVNEFVAYLKLGEYIKKGSISERSQVIATYALCGFSNPGSVGIMVGGLSAMAPERTADIASVAFRSFVAGSAACFLTACVVGMLH